MTARQTKPSAAFCGKLCYWLLVGAIFLGGEPSGAQSLTTFRVANGTSGENPAVLWVGVDQGIFRKHGLNVEVIFMRTGPLSMSALVSGDVQRF